MLNVDFVILNEFDITILFEKKMSLIQIIRNIKKPLSNSMLTSPYIQAIAVV